MTNPLIINYVSGNKWKEIWYKNGEYHKENGPAYLTWYENGNKNAENWYKNDKFHREDGPAVQKWSYNGNKSSEEYYLWGHKINGNDYKWPLSSDDLILLKLKIT